MGSKLRTVSWVLLAVLGSFVLFVSFVSMSLAYRGDYQIGPAAMPVADVAAGRPEILSALRGIRGTSAAYAGAYAALFLAIVFGPYRRGETWAWWALLSGLLMLAVITVLRVPMLGTAFGINAAVIQGVFGLVALLLDVGRLRSARA
jgi:hypothetical protein